MQFPSYITEHKAFILEGMKLFPDPHKAHRGAIFVETAISLAFFIAFTAIIAMMCLALFRYSILTETMATTLRRYSLDSVDGMTQCTDLNTATVTFAKNHLRVGNLKIF